MFTVDTLHSIVSWTTPSLRIHPVDVLTVVLDVTGLAVDTVGSVDHQTHVTRVIRLVLIYSCWAEPSLRSSISGKIDIFWNIVIHQCEVSWLVGFVVSSC